MYKQVLLILTFLIFALANCFAQNLQVETILDLDASGGVTFGPDGNVYVSDFGPALGSASFNTKVYKVEYGTWNVAEFASGFSGASGARFDSQGNFYQANPSGGRVSKVTPDGNVDLNWVTSGMSGGPIGITSDADDNLYVCIHGNNTIQKVTPSGVATTFANSPLFNCPNGITIDPDQNLYVCNFNDGRILKIEPDGSVESIAVLPTFAAGNGHITYSNGFLFVATIGTGQIYKLTLTGEEELIAGVSQGFSNNDGPALQATFSKPNGIAASNTGDTLWVNCSVPTWVSDNLALHPGKVRMIIGVCSLQDVDCPLLVKTKEVLNPYENQYATLSPPTPNPVKLETSISFQIHDTSQKVQLKIVDGMQRVIKILVDDKKPKGIYTFKVNTCDWTAGIYYVVLESKGFVLTQKMVVAK